VNEATADTQILFYDSLILSPTMRRWYGETEYYNVGLWNESIRSPQEASAALVNRLIGGATEPINTALDVGCGLGATTAQIKRAGRRLKWCRS
jgi:cyclopropane fatty-acyl-phospholipid synthase-like methyltransferase